MSQNLKSLPKSTIIFTKEKTCYKMIQLQQILNLSGLPPASIAFTTISLSNHTVCVRDQSQVHLLGLNGAKQSKSITAQSVLIHPSSLILALRSDNTCQVVDLDKKEKLASTSLDVLYWEYSDQDIACITGSSVYLWNNTLVKLFDKQPQLNNCQYISFKRNLSKKWMCIVGLNANDGNIKGVMQLYNTEKNVSQVIEGYCCTFTQLGQWDLFAFVTKIPNALKIHLIEIDHTDGPVFGKKQVDVPLSDANDFPIGCQALNGLLFVFSKMGQFYLIDIESNQLIYMNSMSGGTVFATHLLSDGVLGVNRSGQVLKLNLDPQNTISYILDKFGPDLALSIAKRFNLPGAEDLYMKKYQQLLTTNPLEAAKHAALSPQGLLRTPQTINQLKSLTSPNGNPLLTYFGTLLESPIVLNQNESMELVQRILAQNKKQLLEKWLKDDKLTCTEGLGDLVRQQDSLLALSIYLRCQAHSKAIVCFAETGQFDKIILYVKQTKIKPDYQQLLQSVVRKDAEKATLFAKQLAADPEIHMPLEPIVDIFMNANLTQQATAFLLEALKEDSPEYGHLQTKLLEMNLLQAPQVADAILGNDMFHHYDKSYIASLCEKQGLYQRALEHYEDIYDIKRTLVHTNLLNPEWVIQYFGRLSVDQSLDCLKEMLQNNPRQNLQLVVQIATKYQEQLGSTQLIKLFEDAKTFEGLYYFLSAIVNISQDQLVHFKYIQAAVKVGQVKEVERICRESNYYDPERVKNFLKEAKLTDQLPLVIVCDRFDFIHDLILYLYQNNFMKYIEIYVLKVNPTKTPVVIGALLDVDVPETQIKQLLMQSKGFPINLLVNELEKRGKLKLGLNYLENKVKEQSTDPDVHNALAKIYIDTNNQPELYLKQNQCYDPLLIGQYCEKRDPYLSFIAYSMGKCDLECIHVCISNNMFKHLSKYLISRKNMETWGLVLNQKEQTSPESAQGAKSPSSSLLSSAQLKQLVDQVKQSLSESHEPEDVSTTVKAFMNANLQHELVELLDKLLLNDTPFTDNRNLQNLLILTAIQSDPQRVKQYINQLMNYDAPDVAQLCIDHNLLHEAYLIYDKYEQHPDALEILIRIAEDPQNEANQANNGQSPINESFITNYVKSHSNIPQLWSILGLYQLNHIQISNAIQSFLKSNDFTHSSQLIELAFTSHKYNELLPFLQAARSTIRDANMESDYLFCLCALNQLTKEHLTNSIANVESVGDKCLKYAQDAQTDNDQTSANNFYKSAQLLFTSINQYNKLTHVLLQLNDYSMAVECARKANSIETWMTVFQITLVNHQFKLAHLSGLQLVIYPDELDGVIELYEEEISKELIKQSATSSEFPASVNEIIQSLISLLESSLSLERAHMSLYTSTALVYCKYHPQSLLNHFKLFMNKCNIPKCIQMTQQYALYSEYIYLCMHYDEYLNVLECMIDHVVSFEHSTFKDALQQSMSNHSLSQMMEIRIVQYYMDFHAHLLMDIMNIVNMEHVLELFIHSDNTPLIMNELLELTSKQLSANKSVSNKSLNTLYQLLVECEEVGSLKTLLNQLSSQQLNNLNLQPLQDHELHAMKHLYIRCMGLLQHYSECIEYSIKYNYLSECIHWGVASHDAKLMKKCAQSFYTLKRRDCFIALLYLGYDDLELNIVNQMGWRYKWMDYSMPFVVKYQMALTSRIGELEKQVESLVKEKEKGEKEYVVGQQPLMIAYQQTGMTQQGGQMGTPQMGSQMGTPQMGYQQTGMTQQQMTGFTQQGNFSQQPTGQYYGY
eukprot:NODE_336_length_9298_cov_0.577889.p1 type:complete len:1760 gc:universal NODE_336_length_9298_cov_0.577889:589-5868(+)